MPGDETANPQPERAENLESGVLGSTPLSDADNSASGDQLSSDIEKEKHTQSMQLRRLYARWVLIIAALQIAAVNLFFFLGGVGESPLWPCFAQIIWWEPCGIVFKPPEDLFKVFVVSVFAEVIALAFVVTRSLFPGEGGWLSSILGLFRKEP